MTLLPEFRAQLHAAADQRAHRRRYRVVRHVSIDGRQGKAGTTISLLVSVLVAIGIAVVAITALSNRHRLVVAGTTPQSSRDELLQTIGVLRRPQTETDLLSTLPRGQGGAFPGLLDLSNSPVCRGVTRPGPLCALRLDKPLVRSVRAGGGYQVAIFPTVVARSIPGSKRAEGVVISLRGPGIYLAVSNPRPASAQAIRARGLLLSAYVDNGVNRGVILVPDGVAKVTLDHFRLGGPTAAPLTQIPHASAIVSNNVARFELLGLTDQNLHLNPADLRLRRYFYQGSGRRCQISFAIYGLPATAQMTWLNTAGSIIRNTTTSLFLYVGIQHPAAGTATENPACAQRRTH